MPPFVEHAENPLIERVLQKKQSAQSSRLGGWAALNLCMAVTMYIELTFHSASTYMQLDHPVIWYIECGLAVLFTVNTVVNAVRHLQPLFFPSTIELTSTQKRLLSVKDSDQGFRTASPKSGVSSSSPQRLVFSPSYFSHSHSPHSPSSTPSPSPSPMAHLTPSPGALGSMNMSQSSAEHSRSFAGSPGFTAGGYSGSMSQSFTSGFSPGLLNQSSASVMNQSQMMNASHHSQPSFARAATGSPFTPNLSPLFREASADTSGLRSRYHNISARSSPLSSEDCVTSLGSLNQYLKEQEEKDIKHQLGSLENSPSSGPSFWNYNRSVADYTPILRKYQYQIACRSPQSTKSRTDDDPDDHATYRSEEVWSRLNMSQDELDKGIENLRKWLSQTILSRLVKELGKINKELYRLGNEDMLIGEVSIATLKQLAVTKGLQVPSLNAVIPYLEVCTNQEYLVNRIKELGKGGCMAEFRWDKGGDYKGKPWAEHLPTDCAIVMHILCTYMDCRLPPHPKYPDGKTFTSQHFVKTPDKPNLSKKDNLCIFQSQINPPNYKAALGDDLWELPKGRNNMFQAILLFILYIKTKEHGMLGRVSLGMSGINILQVLEDKSDG